MRVEKILFFLIISLSLFQGALGAVDVKEAWCRPSLKMVKNGAVFMTLESDAPTALVKAESSVSKTVELHTHIQEGEIMRMRAVDQFAITPGQSTVLEPGHDHIMLMGLKKKLQAGDVIDLKLTFADGSTQALRVPVRAGAQKSPCGCRH